MAEGEYSLVIDTSTVVDALSEPESRKEEAEHLASQIILNLGLEGVGIYTTDNIFEEIIDVMDLDEEGEALLQKQLEVLSKEKIFDEISKSDYKRIFKAHGEEASLLLLRKKLTFSKKLFDECYLTI